jgi:hypothetical protein
LGNPEFCGGIFQMSQCVHVPTGASGSSAINANDWTPAGTPDHDKSGEVSAPSQVWPLGIAPPGVNAVVVTASDIALPPSIVDVPTFPGVRASRHANRSSSRTLVRARKLVGMVAKRWFILECIVSPLPPHDPFSFCLSSSL